MLQWYKGIVHWASTAFCSTCKHLKKKKVRTCHLYEGLEFSIWILYGNIISTDLWVIFLFLCWYLIFLHKVANYKHHATENYKASSGHMPAINPSILPTMTVQVLNWRRLFNPIDWLHGARSISESYSIAECMTNLVSNNPHVIIFHLQLLNLYHLS